MVYSVLLFEERLKTQPKLAKKICTVYGTDQTCQKWLVKFHARDV